MNTFVILLPFVLDAPIWHYSLVGTVSLQSATWQRTQFSVDMSRFQKKKNKMFFNSVHFQTIHLVQRPLKTRIRGQAVFLVQFFTMNSIAALAAILFGAAGLSFMFIHFNYAAILFLEVILQGNGRQNNYQIWIRVVVFLAKNYFFGVFRPKNKKWGSWF